MLGRAHLLLPLLPETAAALELAHRPRAAEGGALAAQGWQYGKFHRSGAAAAVAGAAAAVSAGCLTLDDGSDAAALVGAAPNPRHGSWRGAANKMAQKLLWRVFVCLLPRGDSGSA